MLEDVSISKISTLADAYRYNGNIMHSSNIPEIRLGIYEKIDNIGYKKLANTDFHVKNYCLEIFPEYYYRVELSSKCHSFN